MITIEQIIGQTLTELQPEDFLGVTKITYGVFAYNKNLATVNMPDNITSIGHSAFYMCGITNLHLSESLTTVETDAFYASINNLQNLILPEKLVEIGVSAFSGYKGPISIHKNILNIKESAFSGISSLDTSKMNNKCRIDAASFCSILKPTEPNSLQYRNEWYKSLPDGPITLARGEILYRYKGTAGLQECPSTVKTMGERCCMYLENEHSSTATQYTIPDNVEYVQKNPFAFQSTLTKIVVGANVSKIEHNLVPHEKVTTLVFRQPQDLIVDLPTPGEGTGMAYYKDSRAVTIYTDNDSIKNYGWATDNVTATFKPLSEAPA